MIWSTENNPEVEEFELENGNKKIIKYINPSTLNEGFCRAWKYNAKYYFEYIYDSEGNLISKKIKPNPYKREPKGNYPEGYI